MTPKDLSNARVAARQTYVSTMQAIPGNRGAGLGWPAEAQHRALIAADDSLQRAGVAEHWRFATLYAAAAARQNVWRRPL